MGFKIREWNDLPSQVVADIWKYENHLVWKYVHAYRINRMRYLQMPPEANYLDKYLIKVILTCVLPAH